MKYLKGRNEFLVENKITLPKPVNKNKIYLPINESGPMANDIPWGDSLVGRLINSFIRTAKIKYNATKVDNLVKDFKSQLDIVLAESLSRDTRNEFILLMIKSMLNDVERTCSSTKTEEEKVESLLGTRDGNSLWDPKKPNRGSFTENVNDGILLKTHEKIKLDLDKDQIEVAGIPKDDFLGAIGDFIDDLREYAWSLSNNGSLSSQSTTKKSFSIRFKKLLNRIRKPIPQNASYNFIVKNYFDFINESSEDNKIELLKNIINNLLEMYNIYIKKGKQIPESFSSKNTEDLLLSLFTKIDSEKEKFKTIEYDKLLNDIINIHNGKSTESELANLIYFIYKKGDVNEIDKKNKLENINDIKNLFNLFKENMGKLIGSFKKETDKGDESKNIIDKLISVDDESEKEIENIVNNISKSEKEKILNNIINSKEYSDEDKKEAKELLEMIPESYLIKESISSNNTNVLQIWEGWIKDKNIPENMVIISQQEIDKLEDMVNGETSGQNLTFNPKKTPDPIINIVRIFKRAHDLYYTDVIPSGRSAGKVSNKTFREYEKLGTGQTSQSDANSPGYGPWAVKSIRNKWVDGVTKILEDQEYRKIFANTKFIVAGSEDTFNDSVNYKKYNQILESETEDKTKNKSQGQILFDFITDMLKKETAADFDKQKDILLKKYFGNSVEVKSGELKQVNNADRPSKPQDPIDDKTIYWESINTKRINIQRLNTDDDGPIVMFPYKSRGSANTEILKFQVVKEIKGDDKDGKELKAYIIKTFEKVDNTDFYKKDYSTFKVSNDDELGIWKNDTSYAIIFKGPIDDNNIKGGKKFNIIFYNSNTSKSTGLVEIEVVDKSLNGNFVPSVLYKKDSGKSEQINTKDNIDLAVVRELGKSFDDEIKK
jgi:hypothetical protein